MIMNVASVLTHLLYYDRDAFHGMVLTNILLYIWYIKLL